MTAPTKRYAAPGKWCNGDLRTAQIVTDGGGKATGVITRWTGPAECELDTGARGVLAETVARRQANQS